MARPWVFWDFDGTLGHGPHGAGRWAPSFMEALDQIHPGHGVGMDAMRNGLHEGFPWHDPDRPHPELNDRAAWWSAMEAMFASGFARLGFPETANSLAQATRDSFADGSRWSLYEDAIPALELLADAGFAHGVLSNNIPELEAIVSNLAPAGTFEVVLSSACIGYEKPHPEAFEIARRAAGDAEVLWMVGDNPVADGEGAEAAGFNPLLVGSPPDLMAAARTISRAG